MDYELTEADKKMLAEEKEYWKANMGNHNIENYISDETEKFDRRKFGKLQCGFCNHKFNPFYVKTLKQKEWEWVWCGTEFKQPESRCEVNCPKCKKELFFHQYIAQ